MLDILLPILICFTAPEKFASIFLGEFDTPEVIWGAEMRYVLRYVNVSCLTPRRSRVLIEKLALHLADFNPRLRSNTRAIYQACRLVMKCSTLCQILIASLSTVLDGETFS